MEKALWEALGALTKSIDKQNELQEETNNLLRTLIGTLQESGQATADLKDVIVGKASGNPGVNEPPEDPEWAQLLARSPEAEQEADRQAAAEAIAKGTGKFATPPPPKGYKPSDD